MRRPEDVGGEYGLHEAAIGLLTDPGNRVRGRVAHDHVLSSVLIEIDDAHVGDPRLGVSDRRPDRLGLEKPSASVRFRWPGRRLGGRSEDGADQLTDRPAAAVGFTPDDGERDDDHDTDDCRPERHDGPQRRHDVQYSVSLSGLTPRGGPPAASVAESSLTAVDCGRCEERL